MDYEKLIKYCYLKYQRAWCDARGYNLAKYDPENGFNGESFVCLSEFETNEFQNEEYIMGLVPFQIFSLWVVREELKALMIEQRIKMRYILQKAGMSHLCPRCGGEMESPFSHNAFSRRADIYVCSECGMLEALEDAGSPKKPLSDWVIAKLIEGEDV